jgi:hypothetical protein
VNGTGNPSQAVTWSASAGSINPSSGLLTAPGSPTTVIVTATSVQDSSKSGLTNVTVTSGQLSQASSVPFIDQFGSGWTLGSWTDVDVDIAADKFYTTPIGMRVNVETTNYGRMQIKTSAGYKFNTAGYDSISFLLNIGQNEGEDLYIGLLNSSGAVITYKAILNTP